MLHKLRSRVQDEKGFTLIELLVVILIIGILAAIALPAFLNQREKAQDTEAKTGARTAQTALETVFTDEQKYTSGTPTRARRDRAGAQEPRRPRLAVTPAADAYSIEVESQGSNKVKYSIARNATGDVTRTCAPKNKGNCPASGTW